MIRDELLRTEIGELSLEPWLLENQSGWRENFIDQFHHIGTTRMHYSPNYGVVDKDCKVHGIQNLFIGSSSVFPT